MSGSGAIGTGGTASSVTAIAVQSDGKIIIGGTFVSYNGTNINRLARLNADGTRDFTFNIGTGASQSVQTAIPQSDGKFIVGGLFDTFHDKARTAIARLNIVGNAFADFDGDGRTDISILRAFNGGSSEWWIRNSSTNSLTTANWGISSDIATPADFDGDGRTDIAV